jgi:hypothetical protein
MPPIRSKSLREADVWLDETLWGDEPAPRRRHADDRDPDPARTAPGAATGFFDHEREPEAEVDFVVRRGRDAHRANDRPVDAPVPQPAADDEERHRSRDEAEHASVPTGPVPGLLRRPLVEVQRTLPTSGRRRSLTDGPDRIAMWAVALAVLTLVSAIITAHA